MLGYGKYKIGSITLNGKKLNVVQVNNFMVIDKKIIDELDAAVNHQLVIELI